MTSPLRNAAPRPWRIAFSKTGSNNGKPHVYIEDANGRKIMAVWGKDDEKMQTAMLVLQAVNKGEAPL